MMFVSIKFMSAVSPLHASNSIYFKSLYKPLIGGNTLFKCFFPMNHETLECSSSTMKRAYSIDYTKCVNSRALRRKPSMIRELAKAGRDVIFLAGGLPNPDLFPFTGVKVKVKPAAVETFTDEIEINITGEELNAALQYMPTLGYGPLHGKLRALISQCFNPVRFDDTETVITVGSQNALYSILDITMSRGDPIVVPKPIYSSALTTMDPLQPEYISIEEDEEGLDDNALRKLLTDRKQQSLPMPKVMYVNPTGSNPSGSNISSKRRKAIYSIAREFNMIIIEDDPYYFLHFEKEDPVTFLSMDEDGRVIRLDSFSKILSSGLRVGFATGPKELIRHIELLMQASVLHAPSLSQVLVNGVLTHWGVDGFLSHTEKLKEFYKRRRDLMVEAVDLHLKGLVEYRKPKGGMFLWMKICGIEDSFEMVKKGMKKKIVMLPGREFMPNRKEKCQHVRAAYSIVSEEDMNEGMKRFAGIIREEQQSYAN